MHIITNAGHTALETCCVLRAQAKRSAGCSQEIAAQITQCASCFDDCAGGAATGAYQSTADIDRNTLRG